MVEKKTAAKIGLAALAGTALIIGLSVGITQKNKNSASASSAMDMGDYMAIDDCIEPTTSSGKSGKSGGSSGKSGKGEYSMSYSGKSSKSGSDRRLVVPGTEGYKAGPEKRRQLRNEIARGLGENEYEGYDGTSSSSSTKSSSSTTSKSSKSSSDMSVSSKGSKSGSGGSKGAKSCPTYHHDICDTGKSGKSGNGSGKSGKSGNGSGKSGKSGSHYSVSMSYWSGKGGKSGDGSSKGSKSGSGSKGSKSGPPSICDVDCDCEPEDRTVIGVDGKCIVMDCNRGCEEYTGMSMPGMICTDYGFDDSEPSSPSELLDRCCDDLFGEDECKIKDLCPTPMPTYMPTKDETIETPAPTPKPSDAEVVTPQPTYEPTSGGTDTVAKEAFSGR